MTSVGTAGPTLVHYICSAPGTCSYWCQEEVQENALKLCADFQIC